MDSTGIYGQTGVANYPNGIQPIQQFGRQGEGVVSELHGRFYTQALQSKLFLQQVDSTTVASTYVTKSALGTILLLNGIFNPINSGVNAVIAATLVQTTSGTPGGGFYYNYLTDSTINSAATGTIRCANLGAQASLMTAQSKVAVTNVAAGTTAFLQLANVGGPAAIAAGAGVYSIYDLVDGKIIVPPGVIFGLTAAATGTSHVVTSTMWWEEVPV